ncbi:MAG TPA: DUF1292 domain-containing protein [Candidatus Cloacimonadota bacterium]|nr:DUF1292 domain-containing protein [Candidatus Cloacimonadota bacterium]
MIELEKNGCISDAEHNHDCNCEGEDCSCEDHCGDEANIITLDMEDGTQKDFEVLNIIEMDGANYIALAELGANEYDILRFVEVEENLELSIIEDDEEYQRAADRFNELFSSEDDIDMTSTEE